MASRTETLDTDIDITFVGATAFHRICKESGVQPILLRAVHSEVLARSAKTDGTNGLTDMSSIPEEYHDFANVFDEVQANVLAEHRPYDLKIVLEEGALPPLGHIIPLSPREQEALCEFLDTHLQTGFISPSNLPHGAPVLFAPKKDGKLRLCMDFRGLNRIMKKDQYPLLLISDLLNAPHKARIYTKINLKHAYHLIRIAKGDKWKTTFRTCWGSYEWNIMPFGLTNAPAAWQQFINDILADMIDINVIVYLDSILIYSDDLESHHEHV